MIDFNRALRPNPDVVAKRLDSAMVLVHVATNRILELNETGARVWELLSQGATVDQIVRQLVDEFDVEEPRAFDQVKSLINQLESEALLTL